MLYKFTLKDKPTTLYLEAADFGEATKLASAFGEVTMISNHAEREMPWYVEPAPYVPAPSPYAGDSPFAFGALVPEPTAPMTLPREPYERRTPSQIAFLERQVLDYVTAHPGERVETLNTALGTTTADVALPIRHLIEAQHIIALGEKRATRYYPYTISKNAETLAYEYGCAKSSVERYIRLGRVDGEGSKVLMTPKSISYLGRFHDRKMKIVTMQEPAKTEDEDDEDAHWDDIRG